MPRIGKAVRPSSCVTYCFFCALVTQEAFDLAEASGGLGLKDDRHIDRAQC